MLIFINICFFGVNYISFLVLAHIKLLGEGREFIAKVIIGIFP